MSTYRTIIGKIGFLVSSPGFRLYFFNTGWMFVERTLRLVAALFIGAYVARYLGPEQFGLLSYAISLTTLFSAVSTLGLDQVVIRELIRDEGRRDSLLGTAFVLKLAGAAASFLILAALASWTESDANARAVIALVAGGAIFTSFGVIDFYFQAKVVAKFTVWSQLIALIVVSALRIWFVLIEAPLAHFGFLAALDYVLFAIGLLCSYRLRRHRILRWRFDKRLAALLLSSSWPLIFAELATSVYMRFDQILIKWLLGDAAVGNYGVAVRLTEMWHFVPLAICSSLFPAILSAKVTSERQYVVRLQWLFSLMIVLSVFMAVLTTTFSGPIVIMLFGDAYAEASSVLAVYAWSNVFVFLGVANGRWIIAEEEQRFRMVALCMAGALNIALTYILIDYIGLLGAAISSLISHAFAGYFSFLLTRRTRSMFRVMTSSFNVWKSWSSMKAGFSP